MPLIVVIDHQSANIHSVHKALIKCGANSLVSRDPSDLQKAAAAVLPGVGASDAAMGRLGDLGLVEPIKRFAASGRPLLAVCLGMQLLFPSSQEGVLPGLGLIEGTVQRITAGPTDGYGRLKVPHMGWNAVTLSENRHRLFDGIPQGSYFYFVHSYHCVPAQPAVIAATTHYGGGICAAVTQGEVLGTQFHPEKSGEMGLRIYRNFVQHVAARAVA